jgi:murein DD-endopeptidase MepM/ murein hydrolase activator NlpD
VFFLGQGNFRSDPAGGKFMVTIGSTTASYVAPFYGLHSDIANPNLMKRGTWQHIALTRSGNTFQLYLEGEPAYPQITINPRDLQLPSPSTRLRLAKRTTGQFVDNGTQDWREGQFFGLIDDVAVFRKALSKAEIQSIIRNQTRLTGSEAGLYAGWTFDGVYGAATKLGRPVTFESLTPTLNPSYRVEVTAIRASGADAAKLPAPFHRSQLQLPFTPGQVWQVITWNNPNVETHNGIGAFSWDFSLPSNGATQACGKSVYASAGGVVTDLDKAYNGFLQIEQFPDENGRYLHLYPNSTSLAKGSHVQPGAFIAKVGSNDPGQLYNSCHLHMSLKTSEGPHPNWNGVSIPAAFSNYQACDHQLGKNCASELNWHNVTRGIPQEGQWVRRP